ncbi:hypothetical protein FOL47_000350 [Perkinsus chesapeaki]|uniref:Uncharacterized protein n=1 Tax=Perkinsus chesapeaki TaxID=330153 RepID=A0A7J6MLX4_PERCH|nr:hypothetical protein FOL47_000350 [Perkinsus chesapeaki]
MKVRLVSLSYTAFGATPDAESSYMDFAMKYSKVHKSLKEYEAAEKAFAESMREVKQLRRRSDIKHEVGINEYSDMSEEAFNKAMILSDTVDAFEGSPPSVDWDEAGALSPVRNQATLLNNCGACYAIGSAVVMETRFKIRTGIPKVVPFSVQQIIDCSQSYKNDGCISGEPGFSYAYVRKEGIIRESFYPYKAKEGTCKDSIITNRDLQCLRTGDIDRTFIVDKLSERKMIKALASGPVTASVTGTAPALKKYKSGIIRAAACGDQRPDHTVVIVGYGTSSDGIPYWKIMNSWGKSWGMKGFALLERTGTSIPRGVGVELPKYNHGMFREI